MSFVFLVVLLVSLHATFSLPIPTPTNIPNALVRTLSRTISSVNAPPTDMISTLSRTISSVSAPPMDMISTLSRTISSVTAPPKQWTIMPKIIYEKDLALMRTTFNPSYKPIVLQRTDSASWNNIEVTTPPVPDSAAVPVVPDGAVGAVSAVVSAVPVVPAEVNELKSILKTRPNIIPKKVSYDVDVNVIDIEIDDGNVIKKVDYSKGNTIPLGKYSKSPNFENTLTDNVRPKINGLWRSNGYGTPNWWSHFTNWI
jgi:hypothetical protein